MNRNFVIAPHPIADIAAAVFAEGVANPMDVLEDVKLELATMKITGPVLFDLLLCIEHKANRYYLTEFDGEKFQEGWVAPTKHRHDAFALLSANILKERYTEVNPSLLTPAMQFALRRGTPL